MAGGNAPPSGCAEYLKPGAAGNLIFSAQVTPVTRVSRHERATSNVGKRRGGILARHPCRSRATVSGPRPLEYRGQMQRSKNGHTDRLA